MKNNSVTYRTKYYMQDFEREVSNGLTRDLAYVRGENDQYVAIVERINNTNEKTYSVMTDYLGSIERIVDNNTLATVASNNFDAWGRERNPNDLSYLPVTRASNGWDRGYTGHEHIPEFGLINMNGRLYDPVLGRMLSPDPYIMGADNTQGYNRYTYALNNPMTYTDPSGEWVQYVVGAIIGGFSGWRIADAAGYTGWKKFGYTLAGAAVGAASGGFGAAISSSGGIAANTMGIVASSFVNSIGTAAYSGGKTSASVIFGVGSYNFESGELGYLGKKGNSALENIGYGFGALANLQDLVAWNQGVQIEHRAETKDIWHGRARGTSQDGEKIDISVAHGLDKTGYKWATTDAAQNGSFSHLFDYTQYWGTHIKRGTYWEPSSTGLNGYLNNVNGKWLASMTERLGDGATQGRGLWGIGKLKYGTTMFGCQSHVAHALLGVGIPTLPINFIPQVLWGQLMIRQAGIYAAPFLINKFYEAFDRFIFLPYL